MMRFKETIEATKAMCLVVGVIAAVLAMSLLFTVNFKIAIVAMIALCFALLVLPIGLGFAADLREHQAKRQ